MVAAAAVAAHHECFWSGATECLVWEDLGDWKAGLPPDYVCCERCGEMHDAETGELLT